MSVNNIKLISRINQNNMTIGCKLKDLVNIYTSEMYQDLVLKNRNFQNQGYIIVPKKYEFDKTFFFIRHDWTEDNKGFIIIPKEEINLHYIAFWLNSLPTALCLTDGDLSKPATITKKKLISLPARSVDKELMFSLGKCNSLIQEIQEYRSEKDDAIPYLYDLFSEIRDGLSLALVLKSLFDKSKITIIDEWKKVLSGEPKSNIDLISQIVLEKDELINQVQKIRVFITNLSDLLKDSGYGGNMED